MNTLWLSFVLFIVNSVAKVDQYLQFIFVFSFEYYRHLLFYVTEMKVYISSQLNETTRLMVSHRHVSPLQLTFACRVDDR